MPVHRGGDACRDTAAAQFGVCGLGDGRLGMAAVMMRQA